MGEDVQRLIDDWLRGARTSATSAVGSAVNDALAHVQPTVAAAIQAGIRSGLDETQKRAVNWLIANEPMLRTRLQTIAREAGYAAGEGAGAGARSQMPTGAIVAVGVSITLAAAAIGWAVGTMRR